MLSFVRRLQQQRHDRKWNRGVGAFESLLNDASPLGHARPLMKPKVFRVTAQTPYTGYYMEDDMTLARQPDGRLLETYMIDGFAIEGLWLGFDDLACELYLCQKPVVRNGRFLHPLLLLPVYEFTPAMADMLHHASGGRESFHIYTFCVEHAGDYRLFTRDDFQALYLWNMPKVVRTTEPTEVEVYLPPLRLAA